MTEEVTEIFKDFSAQLHDAGYPRVLIVVADHREIACHVEGFADKAQELGMLEMAKAFKLKEIIK